MKPGLIDLVSPGVDETTGDPALGRGGPYLMYITPAMYAANDPAGGYVVVGDPAGVYGAHGNKGEYSRIDTMSPALPATITLGRTALPGATKSEKELLRDGPR
jgi:hypothetical protein